ncbi:unnamed protein product [Citrullus colocynthis]|uniref:Uncharacterized protein n=1 Tax=Citrullus colocynthis TaxID=252529 RepID=A0ABP0YEE9_9ROSI
MELWGCGVPCCNPPTAFVTLTHELSPTTNTTALQRITTHRLGAEVMAVILCVGSTVSSVKLPIKMIKLRFQQIRGMGTWEVGPSWNRRGFLLACTHLPRDHYRTNCHDEELRSHIISYAHGAHVLVCVTTTAPSE